MASVYYLSNIEVKQTLMINHLTVLLCVTTGFSCRGRAGVSFLIATVGSTCTSPTVALVCACIFWWWRMKHLADVGQFLEWKRQREASISKSLSRLSAKADANRVNGWLVFEHFRLARVTQLGRHHWSERSWVALAHSGWLGEDHANWLGQWGQSEAEVSRGGGWWEVS